LINKREAKEAGWKRLQKIGGTIKVMIRRAKHVREGQARKRMKEGKPAYFGAHVEKTRFKWTWLVKSKRARQRADLPTPPRGTEHTN
jgi:hypothetical protein